MTEDKLKKFSYLYLILPIIIFVLGWTKSIVSIPVAILLIIVFIILSNQLANIQSKDEVIISNKKSLVLFLFIIILCITAGHGGLFYQSSDWDARNAIFRDLINYKWPVYYEQNNCALTYYIGQWMVPSLVGKVINLIINCIYQIVPNIPRGILLNNLQNISFQLANIALLFWNALGVFLACLWVIKILNINEKKDLFLAIFIFLFFSGLDIIGVIATNSTSLLFERLHLEWWAWHYQYSSMITQLFWVFNQSIPVWIITLMFLKERKVNNYLVLILLALPFSPLPFLGLIILFGCNGICYLIEAIKDKKTIDFIKDVFSIQNILSFITILPIYAIYYFGNRSAKETEGGAMFSVITEFLNPQEFVILSIFWFLEIGVYGLFLFKGHKKDPLFYTIMISTIIIPLFRVGHEFDFAMRASIPYIVVVNIWIIETFLKWKKEHTISFKFAMLIACLCIGFVTPCYEYYRAFFYITQTHKINLVCDYTKTFSNVKPERITNFVTENPKENSIFFKYIAK